MATTIDVLSLGEATSVQSGDTLLLIRDGDMKTPMRVKASTFQGEKGADGEAYNVDNISASMSRNRLTLTV